MPNEVAERNTNNPFADAPVATRPSNAVAETDQQRAIAETQAAMIIAKRFPRNQIEAMDKILQACTRPTLAESALYTYSRGGTEVTGPSIRLAEAMAQCWGNISFGIRELEQRNGESSVEAFAWDIETNTRQVKTFQVPHKRYTKNGSYPLNDPRDIYEVTANQGARRLRACILGVIPGDVIEAAVQQVETTLKTRAEVTPERLQKLLESFAPYGVGKEQIEARVQRRLDAMTPALLVQLGKIYNSLKDGMSAPADWFDMPDPTQPANGKGNGNGSATQALKEKLKAGRQGNGSREAAQAPAGDPGSSQPPSVADVKALLAKGEIDMATDLARGLVDEAESAEAFNAIQAARKGK